MKRNAIIRIVLWSIVILILSGLLASLTLASNSIFRIIDRLTVSDSADVAHMQTPMHVMPSESTLELIPSDVDSMEIEWVAGTITIFPADVETIRISESDVENEDYALLWHLNNGQLSIQFCQETSLDFPSFGVTTTFSKDLTIQVPRDWVCRSLEVDAASSTLEVHDLTIEEVEIDSASGACGFESCNIGKLDLDTASGDVIYTGSLDILDCDAASASIAAILTNHPTRMDLDTMSGNLDITLPDDCGFTVSMDAMDSDFSSDFEVKTHNGNHIHGDGNCHIDVSAMSGNVTIHKGGSCGDAAHHVHSDSCQTDPDSCPTPSQEHHSEHNSAEPTEHHTEHSSAEPTEHHRDHNGH